MAQASIAYMQYQVCETKDTFSELETPQKFGIQ